MEDFSDVSLDELIDRITRWPVGMPVRMMEKVLARRESAIPALASALSHRRDNETPEPLWLVVLLGELRTPAAIEPLVDQLRRSDAYPLGIAAAEGLAKIGAFSIPSLIDLASSSDPILRIYAYAALGWIPDDRSYRVLTGALYRDRELRDVLAFALRDQGRTEALPLLYEAYLNCEPWQRIDVESSIQELHWGKPGEFHCRTDWRVRYRILPRIGMYDPGWLGIVIAMHARLEAMSERVVIPIRPIDTILADVPKAEAEVCEDCCAPFEYPTGLLICPETAYFSVLHQLAFLTEKREAGCRDLFDVFDYIDDLGLKHYERIQGIKKAERKSSEENEGHIQIFSQTCRWLPEQGVEDIDSAQALLRSKLSRLEDRFGMT